MGRSRDGSEVPAKPRYACARRGRLGLHWQRQIDSLSAAKNSRGHLRAGASYGQQIRKIAQTVVVLLRLAAGQCNRVVRHQNSRPLIQALEESRQATELFPRVHSVERRAEVRGQQAQRDYVEQEQQHESGAENGRRRLLPREDGSLQSARSRPALRAWATGSSETAAGSGAGRRRRARRRPRVSRQRRRGPAPTRRRVPAGAGAARCSGRWAG